MRSLLTRKPPRAGIAGLVAALVIAAAAAVGLSGRSGPMTVTAYFPDSAGLFEGNDVGILGVTVGTVTDIEPDGGRVKVTLEDGPADAGAAVVARSVATDRYVELTPVYSQGPRMSDGASIPVERTRTPVEFDDVLETLNEFATGIAGSEESAQAVRRIVDSGAAALAGQGQQLHTTIGALGSAADTVAGQKDDIVGTLTSLNTLVGQVNANETTVRTFVRQVAEASSLLASQREEFRGALRSLDRAVTTVADFSAKNRADIVSTLDQSSALMKTLTDKQAELAELLEVMPVVMENLQRAETGGALPARVDPLVLAPLGNELARLCEQLPLNLCEVLDGTNALSDLGELLGLSNALGREAPR